MNKTEFKGIKHFLSHKFCYPKYFIKCVLKYCFNLTHKKMKKNVEKEEQVN